MAERVKRKAPAPPVVIECHRPMFVYFSPEVIAERETVRRLAHRVVDLVVDSGYHKTLGTYVADNLRLVAQDHVVTKLTDFVHEAWADDS